MHVQLLGCTLIGPSLATQTIGGKTVHEWQRHLLLPDRNIPDVEESNGHYTRHKLWRGNEIQAGLEKWRDTAKVKLVAVSPSDPRESLVAQGLESLGFPSPFVAELLNSVQWSGVYGRLGEFSHISAGPRARFGKNPRPGVSRVNRSDRCCRALAVSLPKSPAAQNR